MPISYLTKRRLAGILIHIILVLILIYVLFPIGWTFITSIKSKKEIHSFPQTLIPKDPTITPYVESWTKEHFDLYTRNSIIIALATTLIATSLGTIAGYGFSRFRFPGDTYVFAGILAVRLLPPIGLIVPFYRIFGALNILNTKTALITTHVYLNLPLAVWLMRNFFVNIPLELDEIAMVDGCTRIQAFRKVILPLAAPGIAATGILAFLFSWREFLFALTISMDSTAVTLPVGANLFIGDVIVWWNYLSAGGFIAVIPAIIFVAFFQRYLVSGLTAGAIKG